MKEIVKQQEIVKKILFFSFNRFIHVRQTIYQQKYRTHKDAETIRNIRHTWLQ